MGHTQWIENLSRNGLNRVTTASALQAIILNRFYSDETRIEALHTLVQIGSTQEITETFTVQLKTRDPRVNAAIRNLLYEADVLGFAYTTA
jgi:hypothetical protein